MNRAPRSYAKGGFNAQRGSQYPGGIEDRCMTILCGPMPVPSQGATTSWIAKQADYSTAEIRRALTRLEGVDLVVGTRCDNRKIWWRITEKGKQAHGVE